VDFWGLWCRIAAEACCNGYAVVMGDVVVWQGWGGGNVAIQQRWGWIGVEVLLSLIRQRVLSFLLTEDVNGVLQFCQPRALPIDVLSPSLSALGSCLSCHDRLLFLSKPLYLLLDPDQLTLLSLSFIFFCFIPILDFDLVELSFSRVDLQWGWWRRDGVEVVLTSTALTSTCCNGGYVDLLHLNFWNVVEGWVLCSFNDGGEGLSRWLLELKLVLVRGLG
jgi:hypothetical protein